MHLAHTFNIFIASGWSKTPKETINSKRHFKDSESLNYYQKLHQQEF